MANKRMWRMNEVRSGLHLGTETEFSVEANCSGEPPWLDAGAMALYGDNADAVDSFRDAVNDWADQYKAWDSDGEPER